MKPLFSEEGQMKPRIRLFLLMLPVLLLCVAYPWTGHAQWGPVGEELKSKFDLEDHCTAPIATLRTALKIDSEKAPKAREDMDLRIAGFNGELRVRTVGATTSQPWMIYLSAIFNDVKAKRVSHALNQFSQQGFRVMALTNPWSKQYIKTKPGYAIYARCL